MLVYEKKVNDARHLFGTEANVPADNDAQLVYKDADGDVLTLSLDDSYVDAFDAEGNRGIKRLSDGKFFGVFIGSAAKAIIPKDWEPAEKVLKSISVKTAPTKTVYTLEDNVLTMAGLVLKATYEDGDKVDVAYGTEGITYSPTEGAVVASSQDVTITFGGKTCKQAIEYQS